MFFFFPYGTDAPVYYYPVATIGLIVVNLLAFGGMVSAGHEQYDPYLLHFASGLHPVQWVTSAFMHADLFHLIGNMLFLWPFGLVTEGKLGWWRFLSIYMGIAIGVGVLEQVITMFTGQEGASLGASSAIYGLIAISVVWAPKNDLECVFVYWILFVPRVVHFGFPLMYFGVFYVLWEFVAASMTAFALSTPMLHLLGAVLGFPIALTMLLTKRVDCEGWDIIHVWKGEHGNAFKLKEELEPLSTAEQQKKDAARQSEWLEKIRNLLAQDQGKLALKLYDRGSSKGPWQLPEQEHLLLIAALHKQSAARQSVPLMVEFLSRFPERSGRVRLKLGQVLLREEHRPSQALQVLSKLPEGALPGKLEPLRRRLIAEARQRKAEGETVELAPEDW